MYSDPLTFPAENLTAEFSQGMVTPNQLRWKPFPMPTEKVDWVRSLFTICGAGRSVDQAFVFRMEPFLAGPKCLNLLITIFLPVLLLISFLNDCLPCTVVYILVRREKRASLSTSMPPRRVWQTAASLMQTVTSWSSRKRVGRWGGNM